MKEYFRVQKIDDGVMKITGVAQEGMFFIDGGEKTLLLDTGIGCGSVKQFLADQYHAVPDYVVLSHGHADHVGGIFDFKDVWIHKKDIPLLKINVRTEERFECMKSIAVQHGEELTVAKNAFPDAGEYEVHQMGQGDVFDLGDRKLEVIEVPGHTGGSVALLDRKNRMLFSGDAFNQSTFIWGEESTKLSEYRDMLKKFLERYEKEIDRICGAHDSCPDPVDLIQDVLEAAEGVLDGTYKGVPYRFGERDDLFLAKTPKKNDNKGCEDGRLGNIVFSYQNL